MTRPPITRTTHTLLFDKLSPRDLERLGLWLVEREGYERAGHIPNPPSALPLLSDRGKIPSRPTRTVGLTFAGELHLLPDSVRKCNSAP